MFCSAGLIVSFSQGTCITPSTQDLLEAWIKVEGSIDSFPTVTENGNRRIIKFEIEASRLELQGVEHEIRERILVSWFLGSKDQDAFSRSLLYGDRVQIWGKLSVPRSATNKGQFDYRGYLRHTGINVLLYSFGKKGVRLCDRDRGNARRKIHMAITMLREKIRQAINDDFADPDLSALAKAFFIGDQKCVSTVMRDAFIKAGVMHVLAISGFNISIVGFFLNHLFRSLRLPFLINGMITIFFLYGYSLMAGYNLPVRRALVMGTLYVGSMLFQKETNFLSSISLALWLILMIDPEAIYLAGFQLSFVTVGAIVVIVPVLTKHVYGDVQIKSNDTVLWLLKYVVSILFSSIAALFGAIPLLTFHFNSVSLISIVANLAAIPIATVILFVNLLYILSVLIPFFMHNLWVVILKYLFMIFIASVKVCAQLPFALMHTRSPTPVELWVYYVSILLLVYGAQRYEKIRRGCVYGLYGVLLCFVFIMAGMPQYAFRSGEKQQLQCTVFDAGNDLCFTVTMPDGRVVLVNSGRGHPCFDADWVILPYLRSIPVHRLYAIIITSFRARAWGGVERLFSTFMPQYLMIPNDYWQIENKKEKMPMLRKNGKKIIYIKDRVLNKNIGSASFTFFTDTASQYKDMSIMITFGKRDVVALSSLNNVDSIIAALQGRQAVVLIVPGSLGATNKELLLDTVERIHPELIVWQGDLPQGYSELTAIPIVTKISGMLDLNMNSENLTVFPYQGESLVLK
jgi:ComEC/Rec2-related protein